MLSAAAAAETVVMEAVTGSLAEEAERWVSSAARTAAALLETVAEAKVAAGSGTVAAVMAVAEDSAVDSEEEGLAVMVVDSGASSD